MIEGLEEEGGRRRGNVKSRKLEGIEVWMKGRRELRRW